MVKRFGIRSKRLPSGVCLGTRFKARQRLDRHPRSDRQVRERQSGRFSGFFELSDVLPEYEVKRRRIGQFSRRQEYRRRGLVGELLAGQFGTSPSGSDCGLRG
jgi:hypothetical protein